MRKRREREKRESWRKRETAKALAKHTRTYAQTNTHTNTHARTHARTHALTHERTHTLAGRQARTHTLHLTRVEVQCPALVVGDVPIAKYCVARRVIVVAARVPFLRERSKLITIPPSLSVSEPSF